jgi:hypothetical protein
MPPPRGEEMTGSPPSGPALPMRARAGDPTGIRSSNPTHSPGRLTSFLLRHHKPAPNDGVDVKDLRPLTRSALPGRSWTPTPEPALPKSGGGRKKKINQPWAAQLDRSSPFRDDSAAPSTPITGKNQPAWLGRLPAWCLKAREVPDAPSRRRSLCSWPEGSGLVRPLSRVRRIR